MITPGEYTLLLTDEVQRAIAANRGRDPLEVALDRNTPHARLVATQVKYLVWMILPVNWLAPAFDAVLSDTAGLLNTLARAAAAFPGGYAEYTLGGGATAGIYLFFLLTTLTAWSFEPKKSVHLPA